MLVENNNIDKLKHRPEFSRPCMHSIRCDPGIFYWSTLAHKTIALRYGKEELGM